VTRVLSVETPTHGRVLIEDAAAVFSGVTLVAFHGYGQSAEEMLEEVRAIPGAAAWRLVSVQGLHRFYTRADERVVASWMTRQDREDAIADNVAYVDRALDSLTTRHLVFVGLSQGASMAYRAAQLGRHRATGVVAVGGDIPPELKDAADRRTWPPVLIGAGVRDRWYTGPRLEADVEFLKTRAIRHDLARYDGGHEWTDGLKARISEWIGGLF
jgi:predicted esterase